MVETQLIKYEDKPIAIILDYKEYQRLKELEQDMEDYYSAYKTKKENTKWVSHSEIKKEFGIE